MSEGARLRVDKWLWFARFFKTRTLAARVVTEGAIRINGDKAAKPAATVGTGDVLTIAQPGAVRVVRILAIGARRGPAPEARALYEDMSPPESEREPVHPGGDRSGRPTKKQRRDLDCFRQPGP